MGVVKYLLLRSTLMCPRGIDDGRDTGIYCTGI